MIGVGQLRIRPPIQHAGHECLHLAAQRFRQPLMRGNEIGSLVRVADDVI